MRTGLIPSMILAVALAIVVIGEAAGGVRQLPVAFEARATGSPARPLSQPPSDDARLAADVIERPLFSPARRPAPTVSRGVAPGLPRLAGTVLHGRDGGVAILQFDGAARLVVLRAGEQRNGLLITRVSRGLVLGRDGSGGVTLRLTGTAAAAPLPPAAAPFAMTKDPRSRASDNQDE